MRTKSGEAAIGSDHATLTPVRLGARVVRIPGATVVPGAALRGTTRGAILGAALVRRTVIGARQLRGSAHVVGECRYDEARNGRDLIYAREVVLHISLTRLLMPIPRGLKRADIKYRNRDRDASGGKRKTWPSESGVKRKTWPKGSGGKRKALGEVVNECNRKACFNGSGGKRNINPLLIHLKHFCSSTRLELSSPCPHMYRIIGSRQRIARYFCDLQHCHECWAFASARFECATLSEGGLKQYFRICTDTRSF